VASIPDAPDDESVADKTEACGEASLAGAGSTTVRPAPIRTKGIASPAVRRHRQRRNMRVDVRVMLGPPTGVRPTNRPRPASIHDAATS
jgi:hypothetical protein